MSHSRSMGAGLLELWEIAFSVIGVINKNEYEQSKHQINLVTLCSSIYLELGSFCNVLK